MIRNILFDFDGTLYDTVEGIEKSAQYALQKLGISAQLEELKCFAGPPLVDIFMEKFGFSHEKAWEARGLFQERYIPIGVYESRPFPGMKDFLSALKDRGLTLAVATSKPLEKRRTVSSSATRNTTSPGRMPRESRASACATAMPRRSSWRRPGPTRSPRIWRSLKKC